MHFSCIGDGSFELEVPPNLLMPKNSLSETFDRVLKESARSFDY